MIECGKCGTANHFDGAIFCKSCGAELSARVAVKVEDEPIPDQKKAQDVVAQPDNAIAQEESDFIITDLPGDETVDRKPAEQPLVGGFDQLLKRYENEQTPTAQREEAIEPAQLSSDLGIESPTDYLMREQQESVPESPEVAPDRETNMESSHLQPVLSPMNEPKVEKKIDAKPKRDSEHIVSDDERNKLLSSLQKTLAEEDAVAAKETTKDVAAPQASAAPPQWEPKPAAPPDVQAEEMTESTITKESAVIAVASRATQTQPHLSVLMRGHNLVFPEKAHLVPGEHITYGNQQYMIKKGSLDRKQLIIGAAIGLVVVTSLLIAMFSGSSGPKPSLYGVVTNSETREILAGVTVTIQQTGASTVTDEAGMFKFPGLADGRYDLKVEGGLYETQMMPASILNGESKMVHGTLSPLLAQKQSYAYTPPSSDNEAVVNSGPLFGSLKVKCSISDATVLVDGKALGSVGQTLKRIAPGTHTVEVQREGYEVWSQQVKIDEDQTTTLTAALAEAKSAEPVAYGASDFFQQAEALYAEKNYTEAIGYYTLALAKDNTMVQAYIRRAEANEASGKNLNARADYRSAADLYLHSNRFADAVGCYDKIIAMSPNASDAYQLRGWAKIASGNYDSGLKDLEKALSFNKDDTQSQFEYGKALYITNNYKESEKTLKKIRKYADDTPEIYGYLALTYLAQGNESDARKNYESFTKRANSSQVARMSTESGWQRLTATAGK
jgi:hypothetical protein